MAVKRGRPMSFQAHMEELACEQLAMCRERVVVSMEEYKRAKAFAEMVAAAANEKVAQ